MGGKAPRPPERSERRNPLWWLSVQRKSHSDRVGFIDEPHKGFRRSKNGGGRPQGEKFPFVAFSHENAGEAALAAERSDAQYGGNLSPLPYTSSFTHITSPLLEKIAIKNPWGRFCITRRNNNILCTTSINHTKGALL